MDKLTPNTSLALMQAAQTGNAGKVSALKEAAKTKSDEHIDAVAKDFEAMFISEMMKPMFEGVKPDEMFGGGKGEEVFSGMMLQEYGKMIAQTGQLGIAAQVKEEMIRLQEEADHGTTAQIETAGN